MYIGFLPTWGDKWNIKRGAGPEIFNPQNAGVYGAWLGERYKDTPNIIWILGGDRAIETDAQRETIRAMARGLRTGDGGAHLMTLHPTGGSGSSAWFHDDDWLDFNMRQNGHTPEFTGRYDQTRADYNRTPVKPVVDGEPMYEDHPVSFNAASLGHSIASDVRRPLYWDLFSGAFGHTYGHHSVWQMWAPGRSGRQQPADAVVRRHQSAWGGRDATRPGAARVPPVSHARARRRGAGHGSGPDEHARCGALPLRRHPRCRRQLRDGLRARRAPVHGQDEQDCRVRTSPRGGSTRGPARRRRSARFPTRASERSRRRMWAR